MFETYEYGVFSRVVSGWLAAKQGAAFEVKGIDVPAKELKLALETTVNFINGTQDRVLQYRVEREEESTSPGCRRYDVVFHYK